MVCLQGDLKVAAEHFSYLLEGRNREVANSTYKDLLNLLDEIASCPYPEAKPLEPEDETPVTPDVDKDVVSF